VSETIENVVLRALATSPADRYPTAEAFRSALDAAADDTVRRSAAGRNDAPVPPASVAVPGEHPVRMLREQMMRWVGGGAVTAIALVAFIYGLGFLATQAFDLKLQVPAGQANPSPPIGPALGQRGLNIMEFCKAFNAATQNMDQGSPVPTVITIFHDKSFTFETRTPPASYFLKKAAKISWGS